MILIPTVPHTGTQFALSLFGTKIELTRHQCMRRFDRLRPDMQQELVRRFKDRKDGVSSDSAVVIGKGTVQIAPDNDGIYRPPSDSHVLCDHISEISVKGLVALGKKMPMIIPLRHPKVAAVSWKSRGRSQKQMCDAFRLLVKYLDPLEPHYLPIDTDHRQDFLDKINTDLELNLQTDWKPVGDMKGNFDLRHDKIKASKVVTKLCQDIKPFLDRFYD